MFGEVTTTGERPSPCLRVEELCYSYGSRFALERVSFALQPGRLTALLGPNGAGKSTLIALLCGLIVPRSGRIEVLGEDFARNPRRALAQMGLVFQQQTLDLDLTVRQNLQYFAALQGLAGRATRERSAGLLTEFGLAGREKDPVRALNSGHRRRLEIARALLHEPRLLLLDEPTVGLDVPARRGLVQLVHDLARERGLTVLWATHLVDEVWPQDDVVVLDAGEVRETGPLPDVMLRSGTHSVLELFTRLTGAHAGGGDPAGSRPAGETAWRAD